MHGERTMLFWNGWMYFIRTKWRV